MDYSVLTNTHPPPRPEWVHLEINCPGMGNSTTHEDPPGNSILLVSLIGSNFTLNVLKLLNNSR